MYSFKRLLTGLVLTSMLTACGHRDRLDPDNHDEYVVDHLPFYMPNPDHHDGFEEDNLAFYMDLESFAVDLSYPGTYSELKGLSEALSFETTPSTVKWQGLPETISMQNIQEGTAIDDFERDSVVIVACNKAAEKVRWACITTKAATKQSCDIFAGWVFDGCDAEFSAKPSNQ